MNGSGTFMAFALSALASVTQAVPTCTVNRPEVGSLARLSGASRLHVDRNGLSLDVAPGEPVCAEDVIPPQKAEAAISFAVAPELAIRAFERVVLPSSRALAEGYRNQLATAQHRDEKSGSSLAAAEPGYGIAALNDLSAEVSVDHPHIRIPLSGGPGDFMIEVYPPGALRPSEVRRLGADADEIVVEAKQTGQWKLVLVAGGQRLVGGFRALDTRAVETDLLYFRRLGLTEAEAAMALASQRPGFALEAYQRWSGRSFAGFNQTLLTLQTPSRPAEY